MLGRIIEREKIAALEEIEAHRRIFQHNIALVLSEVPEIRSIIESDDPNILDVDYPTRKPLEGENGSLNTLSTVVTLQRENNDKQIYFVRFSDKDYPDKEIIKGFTVYGCTDPTQYQDSNVFFNKTKIWKEIDEPAPVVALAICGLVNELTTVRGGRDFNTCLAALKQLLQKDTK